MTNENLAYVREHGLDPDTFFVGAEGPISPKMCKAWIAHHEQAVEHPDISYDDDTGMYDFQFQAPAESEDHLRENRQAVEAAYRKNETTDVVFTSAAVFFVGSVPTPGTAVMLSRTIEAGPSLARNLDD